MSPLDNEAAQVNEYRELVDRKVRDATSGVCKVVYTENFTNETYFVLNADSRNCRDAIERVVSEDLSLPYRLQEMRKRLPVENHSAFFGTQEVPVDTLVVVRTALRKLPRKPSQTVLLYLTYLAAMIAIVLCIHYLLSVLERSGRTSSGGGGGPSRGEEEDDIIEWL